MKLGHKVMGCLIIFMLRVLGGVTACHPSGGVRHDEPIAHRDIAERPDPAHG